MDAGFVQGIQNDRLEFTANLSTAIAEPDNLFLCPPTPQGNDGRVDLP
jgi:UDP-glucose 6-dehydrogenase